MQEYMYGLEMAVYNPLNTPVLVPFMGRNTVIGPRDTFHYMLDSSTVSFRRDFDRKVVETAKDLYLGERRQIRETILSEFLSDDEIDLDFDDEVATISTSPMDSWENERRVIKPMLSMSQPELCRAIGYLDKGANAWGQQSKIVSLRRVLREKRNAV